eukprot:2550674-Rhodomonas_salina.2
MMLGQGRAQPRPSVGGVIGDSAERLRDLEMIGARAGPGPTAAPPSRAGRRVPERERRACLATLCARRPPPPAAGNDDDGGGGSESKHAHCQGTASASTGSASTSTGSASERVTVARREGVERDKESWSSGEDAVSGAKMRVRMRMSGPEERRG